MKKIKNHNIFLVGPMGAGKSSVGKELARQLDMDFYDTDEVIEQRAGADIGWIFDLEGESGFRKREEIVIADLTQHSHIVLATGGGSIVDEVNRKALASRGTVVYLELSLDYQKTRTLYDVRRPLLRVDNRQEVLIRLMEEREPLYQSIADFRVLTDDRSVRKVVGDIIAWINE